MYKSQFSLFVLSMKVFKKKSPLQNWRIYCLTAQIDKTENLAQHPSVYLRTTLWFNYYWKFLTIISTFLPIRWCFSPLLTKVQGQSKQICNVNKVYKSMWSASILTKLEKLLTIKDSEVLSFWNRSNLFFVLRIVLTHPLLHR